MKVKKDFLKPRAGRIVLIAMIAFLALLSGLFLNRNFHQGKSNSQTSLNKADFENPGVYESAYTNLAFLYPEYFGKPAVSYEQYGNSWQEAIDFLTEEESLYLIFNQGGVERGGIIAGLAITPLKTERAISQDGYEFNITVYSLEDDEEILTEASGKDEEGKEILYLKTLTRKPKSEMAENISLFQRIIKSMNLGID